MVEKFFSLRHNAAQHKEGGRKREKEGKKEREIVRERKKES